MSELLIYCNMNKQEYIREYLVLQDIDMGQYGRVIKYAMKIVEIFIPQVTQQGICQRKKRRLKTRDYNCLGIQSINVVHCFDYFQDRGKQYSVFQLCEKSLSQMISQLGKMTETESIFYFKQIVRGYYQIHKRGLIHRDIKPGNIFIKNGILKIGDFGSSKHASILQQNKRHSRYIGTLVYMAPEVIHGQYYSYLADIWSIGIVFHEMLTGNYPFIIEENDFDDKQKISQIIDNFLKDKDDKYTGIPQKCANLISKCLVTQFFRISLKQLMTHEIFNKQFHNLIAQSTQEQLIKFIRKSMKGRSISELLANLGTQTSQANCLTFSQFCQILSQVVDIDKNSAIKLYNHIRGNGQLLKQQVQKVFCYEESQENEQKRQNIQLFVKKQLIQGKQRTRRIIKSV